MHGFRNSTAAFVVPQWLSTYHQAVLWMGFAVSLLAVLLNFYFSLRFSRLEVLSSNLRLLIVANNLISLPIIVFHCVLQLFPPSLDSIAIAQGNYFGAALFYGFQIYTRIAAYIFGFKYIFITVERHFALRHQHDSDGEGCGFAVKTLIIMIGQTVRLSYLMASMWEKPLDQRLRDTFLAERQPADYITLNAILGVSVAVSAYDIFFLSRYVDQNRAIITTLAAGFQLRQTAELLRVVKVLFGIHLAMSGFFTVTVSIMIYDYWFGYGSVDSPIYVACVDTEYATPSLYILITTLYLCCSFQPMRKAFAADLRKFLGISGLLKEKIHVFEAERHVETDNHFDYLSRAWN